MCVHVVFSGQRVFEGLCRMIRWRQVWSGNVRIVSRKILDVHFAAELISAASKTTPPALIAALVEARSCGKLFQKVLLTLAL